MDSVVRRLGAADAADYRAHRLRGLREHPTAFGSTHARELAMPAEAFAARLERSASFGAFADQALVGIVSVVVAEGPKVGHKGSVVGVYVAAAARGGGVGEALMRAAIADGPSMRPRR